MNSTKYTFLAPFTFYFTIRNAEYPHTNIHNKNSH